MGEARQKTSDGDGALQTGEIHAGTHVDAAAKGQMSIDRAADVKALGVIKLFGVAVGGTYAKCE